MEGPLHEGGPLVGSPFAGTAAREGRGRALRLEARRLEDGRRSATGVRGGCRTAERTEAQDNEHREKDLEPTKAALAGKRQGHAPIV